MGVDKNQPIWEIAFSSLIKEGKPIHFNKLLKIVKKIKPTVTKKGLRIALHQNIIEPNGTSHGKGLFVTPEPDIYFLRTDVGIQPITKKSIIEQIRQSMQERYLEIRDTNGVIVPYQIRDEIDKKFWLFSQFR